MFVRRKIANGVCYYDLAESYRTSNYDYIELVAAL
jgi:hypothetical protein